MSEVRDEVSERLLEADFDPIDYLNDTLPSLNLTSQGVKQNRTSQLQSSWTDIQSQVSRLNAYNARASTELTTLTDEILRSGNKLAYEVEVLRSDANSLFDLLSETLQEDIQQFVREEVSDESGITPNEGDAETAPVQGTKDPEFMQQLRLLGNVKARLEEVIRVFGDALKWPIPPSDVSVASTLISVSAPELGVASSAEDDKARATIRQFREELSELLNSEGGGIAGLEAANKRLVEWQNLALVWKGTAEEKARNRVVDGFAKIVDDRKRQLESHNRTRRPQYDSARNSAQPSRSGTPSLPAGGLFGGLRKLRDEIYLD
ncbi:hypothetical protein OHC33_007201 [Knufia fluminis]|uniref:Uncharacterized protein n=1 Tax=Knufia fluminis TaxID=191047 RepID=A0AAN8EHW4_9EURO|nr:hypothetical protein OHC33_007201 [Knufia fluminis]